MDENIVEEIKKTEAEAQELIKQAHKRARSIVEDARKRAFDITAEGKKKVALMRREAVEAGRREGEKVFSEIVKNGEKEASAFIEQYKDKIKEVSGQLLEEVLSSYGS